jgi:hypothetical protein
VDIKSTLRMLNGKSRDQQFSVERQLSLWVTMQIR